MMLSMALGIGFATAIGWFIYEMENAIPLDEDDALRCDADASTRAQMPE